MENNKSLELIKAEIERRKRICEGIFERESDTYYQGKAVAYGELLPFIDSLLDDEPSKGLDVTDFCKPIDPDIAQCIADNFWEMAGEPVSKDLEEEIAIWIPEHIRGGESGVWKECREVVTEWAGIVARHFAEWGAKSQEKKIADAYEKGKQEGIRVVSSWESSPGQGGC